MHYKREFFCLIVSLCFFVTTSWSCDENVILLKNTPSEEVMSIESEEMSDSEEDDDFFLKLGID